MNIFQNIGDFLHGLSFLILNFKFLKTRSCIGLSAKTQILYAVVFMSRYLDIFYEGSWDTQYITAISLTKIIYVLISFSVIYAICFLLKDSYERQYDTFRVEFLSIPSFLLALLCNHGETLYAYSLYLEAVAVLPQMQHIINAGKAGPYVLPYLMLLGSYRSFYVAKWIYLHEFEESYYGKIKLITGVVQTLIYIVFFIFYFCFHSGKPSQKNYYISNQIESMSKQNLIEEEKPSKASVYVISNDSGIPIHI